MILFWRDQKNNLWPHVDCLRVQIRTTSIPSSHGRPGNNGVTLLLPTPALHQYNFRGSNHGQSPTASPWHSSVSSRAGLPRPGGPLHPLSAPPWPLQSSFADFGTLGLLRFRAPEQLALGHPSTGFVDNLQQSINRMRIFQGSDGASSSDERGRHPAGFGSR